MDGQIENQMYRWMNERNNRGIERQIGRKTDRDIQAVGKDAQIKKDERRKDRQIDRQK